MSSSSPQAILLVDGYNIIGAWRRLQHTRDRHGLEEARHELVHALIDYSAYQSLDTHIVFDSQYQDSPGRREVVTGNIAVCYTDYRQTADTYIEKACALYRKDVRKYSQRLIVATSDRAQQLTVMGYGAEWLSAERLQLEVDLAAQQVRRQQRSKKQARASRGFLANSIDPSARQKLTQLRLGAPQLGREDRSPKP